MLHIRLITRKTRDIHPKLEQCWASVVVKKKVICDIDVSDTINLIGVNGFT